MPSKNEPTRIAVIQINCPELANCIINSHLPKKDGKGGNPSNIKTDVPNKITNRGFLRRFDQSFIFSALTIPDIQNNIALAK